MMVNISPTRVYQTKEEYVYQVLRTAILNCELKPGEKLVMDQLKVDLGTSPIPIRSALQRLEVEGWVKTSPHSVAEVSRVSLEEISEIFIMLENLERTALRYAAQRITDDDLQRLDEIVTRMDGAMQIQNTRLWSELNILFHRTIAELSRISLLAEFTNRVLDQWMRFSRYYFAQIGTLRMEQAQSEHRQILEWLQMQEMDSLEKMAESHNHLALLAYQELLENEEFGI